MRVLIEKTPAPKSWQPEVSTDNTGKWYSNALRFATEKEAYESAGDLACRWMMVRDFRAAPSEDPVNYARVDGKDVSIERKG